MRRKQVPPLSCAVVGLGRIGSTLEEDPLREKPASHCGAIAANPDCLLVAGCDLKEQARRTFSARWGCAAAYEDCGRMLSERHPDILHIATAARTHAELVRLAARNGVSLVICEKPLTLDGAEARRLLRLCARAGTVLMVNHERRYSLDYRHARGRIEEGLYGDLLSITAKLYSGRNKRARDILWHDGTHMVDALRYLTGRELSGAQSFGDPDSRSRPFLAAFKAGPVRVALETCGGHESFLFELDLMFAAGRIRIGNGLYEEYRCEPSPFYSGFRSLMRVPGICFPKTEYFKGLLQDAVAVLRNPGRVPTSRGSDGCKAVETIERLLSRASGR